MSPAPDVDLTDLDVFGEVAGDLIADAVDGLDLRSVDVVATSLGGHDALRGAVSHAGRA